MDYNNYEQKIMKKAKKYLSNAQLTTLKKFQSECKVQGVKVRTRCEYLKIILDFGNCIKKPYEKVAKVDIMKFLEHKMKTVMDSTLSSIKIVLKRFYRVLNNGECPESVKWLETSRPKKMPIENSGDIITEADILKMIKVCDHPRNKALISALHESACRASEIMDLKIKSVSFDENGTVLFVNGKTGQRRIRLVNSTPYLEQWLNAHPYKKDKDSPLWVVLRNRGKKCIDLSGLTQMLKKTAERAKIDKPIRPHLLRHSRLTELAKMGLSEYKLKIFAGWTMDSKMASIYVHMSGQDIDGDIIELNNDDKRPTKKPSALKPRICPRCEKENPPDAQYCNCGHVLDVKLAMEIEESKDYLLKKLLLNPDIQRLLGATKTDDGRLVIELED